MSISTSSLLLIAACVLLAACSEPASTPDPQAIVDRAIATHGSDRLKQAVVTFDFRGKHFTVMREGGTFSYERTYARPAGTVREVLNNDTLYREIDGRRVSVPEDTLRAIETAVNSVVYFGLLPHKLNDPAVQKRYLGATTLDGEPYHEVEVTFQKQGGGRDYQDRFVYWIHQDRHTMDYLAYTYEEDEGGTRFREAINPRTAGDVRFLDYRNYTYEPLGDSIQHYDDVPRDSLELVSEIRLENVDVRPLPP